MATKIKLSRGFNLCAKNLLSSITVIRPTDTPNNFWNNQLLDSDYLEGDLELCFTIGAMIPNSVSMIGLNSDIATDEDFTSIDYGFYIYEKNNTKLLRVYESGQNKGTFPVWNTGDKLSIRRTITTIEYLVNGVVIYTSLLPSLLDLAVDSSFYYSNGVWASGSSQFTKISLCPQ